MPCCTSSTRASSSSSTTPPSSPGSGGSAAATRIGPGMERSATVRASMRRPDSDEVIRPHVGGVRLPRRERVLSLESGAASTTDAGGSGRRRIPLRGTMVLESTCGHPRVPSDGQSDVRDGPRRARSRVDHPTETCGVERPRRARKEPVTVRVCVDNLSSATLRSADPGTRSSGPLRRELRESGRRVA